MTYTSIWSSGSVDPSYRSSAGLFQLGGNSVAIMSSVKWYFLDELTIVLCDGSPPHLPSCREPFSSIRSSLWVHSRYSLSTLCLSLSFSSRSLFKAPTWCARSSSCSFLISSSLMVLLASIVPSCHHCFVRLISAPQWVPKYSCKRPVSSNNNKVFGRFLWIMAFVLFSFVLVGLWIPVDWVLHTLKISGGGLACILTLKLENVQITQDKVG